MVAWTRPRTCFCGVSQLVFPCLFHGGDLEARVGRVMSAVHAVDTETDNDLNGAAKWLAFSLAGATWHQLPWMRQGQCDRVLRTHRTDETGARMLGDLAIGISSAAWDARQAISAVEMAALHGEAVLGRWPWSAS